MRAASIAALLTLAACSDRGDAPAVQEDTASEGETPFDAASELALDTSEALPPLDFLAVSFNTGTGAEMSHDAAPDDGYGSAQAALTDQWYGNGLNWPPLVEETRAFFELIAPDLVVFQEIFYSGECPAIPEEARTGFVCEGWSPGDPTVAQLLLGEGWQVMCQPGKPDKCAAVRRAFGTFRGCEADFCLEGMQGSTVEGCGSGARVGRALIDVHDGRTLTLVNVHGSSGLSDDDAACRVKQIDQIFVDLGVGDGPAVNGERNLVMGDLNTDPARLAGYDASADRWNEYVGADRSFRWISEVGEDVTPTYAGVGNIDHAASDVLTGTCWSAGITAGKPAVSEMVYYDHRPLVCALTGP